MTTTVPATTTAAASRQRALSVSCAWAAAGCLALPAAANTAYHLLTPVNFGTTAGAVAQAAAHPALAQVATLQFALPVLAMGVAVLAWRASAVTLRLATVAGVFLAGAFLLSPLGSLPELLTAILPRYTGTAAATRAVDGYGHTIAGYFGAVALAGQALGLILMAIVLWRSRIVPRWLAVAFGVTFPLLVLTHSGTDERVFALGWLLLACGCGLIVKLILDQYARTVYTHGAALPHPAAAEFISGFGTLGQIALGAIVPLLPRARERNRDTRSQAAHRAGRLAGTLERGLRVIVTRRW